ncbi:response regulator transcription factor [Halobacillus litoralis]|uniref:response regulator transcription factor n=1 Tax=Halobacillus litoralis TaxID=45668 RepID=UPI001CD6A334|nr:response regulator transcription factor [Halobacillus litoralis]MCA0970551.1 response regulator transcription factor [Halobacillus litoralis]
MRVLVVDDEQDMIHMVKSYLERYNYQVMTAMDGVEAVKAAKNEEVDLIILDIMMPKMDGVTACREIRSFSDVPILMLTAKSDPDDRVIGLRTGADDYIVKPFSLKELLARVEATLRRSKGFQTEEHLFQHKELMVDLRGHVVEVEGQRVNLTRKEFLLLSFLVQHVGQVFTREQLLDRIWGLESGGTMRTVDTHVKTLRLKLKSAGAYIQTVWGVGYKFS